MAFAAPVPVCKRTNLLNDLTAPLRSSVLPAQAANTAQLTAFRQPSITVTTALVAIRRGSV